MTQNELNVYNDRVMILKAKIPNMYVHISTVLGKGEHYKKVILTNLDVLDTLVEKGLKFKLASEELSILEELFTLTERSSRSGLTGWNEVT